MSSERWNVALGKSVPKVERWGLVVCGIGCSLALAFGVWSCSVFWPFTVDDTFITLRYARNLAHGFGLTWNPGEEPAEGYTSFAWTVLMAAPHLFTDDAEYCAKLGSLGAATLSVVLTAGFAADVTRSKPLFVRAVAVTFVVLWQTLQLGTTVHAVSGMDTSLFSASVVGLAWCGYRALRKPSKRNFVAFAFGCLVCGLTRPEGNVFAFVLTLATAASLKRSYRRSFGLTWCIYFVAPAAFYFVCRVLYYGRLFPLPFYVKAVGTEAFFAGAQEAGAFLYELAWCSPAFAVLALVGIACGPALLRPLWWASLALFLFFLKPVPLMAYNHRYLHPLIPLLAVSGATGIAVTYDAVRTRLSQRTSATLMLGLVVLAWFGAALFTRGALAVNRADKDSYSRGLSRAHKQLGRELATFGKINGERRIALLDVGAVAYYARDWSVLDTFGLTDATIALKGRAQTDYVLGQEPSFVVFVSSRPDQLDLVFPHERPLLEASRAAGYRQVNTREFVPDYHLVVFAK